MKIPCVGGHHDGQWIEVEEGIPEIRLPIIDEPMPPVYDKEQAANAVMRDEDYVLQSIYTSRRAAFGLHESVIISSFWRHESLSEWEGIKRLVNGYRQPVEDKVEP